MKILLNQKTPTESGHYLWKGSKELSPQLITVELVAACSKFGYEFPAYFGVMELTYRNVEQLQGKFSEKLDIKD